MQIHELTLKRKTQVDEGIGDFAKGVASKAGGLASKVAGGVQKAQGAVADIKGAYQGARTDQKVAATADKAYRAWSTYKQQLDKAAPGGKADPATIEKQLLAFVSKNLLGGQYFQNLINKDQILSLVKQIATGGTQPATQKPKSGGKVAGQLSQTPGAIKKREQRAATKAQQTAGSQAFGQMATQLQQPTAQKPQAPATTTPQYGKQPATTYNVPTAAVPKIPPKTTTPTAPAKPTLGSVAPGQTFTVGGQKVKPGDPLYNKLAGSTIKEAANPQELELFKKLVTAAAQAQTEVNTGQDASAKKGAGQPQTAGSLVGQVRDTEQQQAQITPQQLAKAGQVLMSTFQIDSAVGSTGDKAVDALLMAMGFKPQ